MLWLTQVSTAVLAPLSFSLFMFARRYAASLSSLVHLGGPPSLKRYGGIFKEEPEMLDLLRVTLFLIFSLIACCVLLTASVFSSPLEQLFLGTEIHEPWFVGVLAALVVQQIFHFLAISGLLIERRMVLYNLYKLATAAGFFILIFYTQKEDIHAQSVLEQYILLSFIPLLAYHLPYSLKPLLFSGRKLPWNRLPELLKELVSYGPPRALIQFLDASVFLVVPWLMRTSPEQAGFVLTIFLFLQLSSLIVLPINELSMILTAENIKAGVSKLQKGVPILFECLFIFSCVLVIPSFPYLKGIFSLVIGSDDILAGVLLYKIILFCTIPLTLFNGLKGFIEMHYKAPLNLFTLIFTNGVMLTTFYLLNPLASVEIVALGAIGSGLCCLGGLTVFWARSFLAGVRWKELQFCLLSQVVVLICGFVFIPVSIRESSILSFPAAASSTLVGFLLWVIICKPRLVQRMSYESWKPQTKAV